MRTAFIQLGADHESLASQVARLKPVAPDVYHIEETPTVAGARRLTERLETLKSGDELLLLSLHSLGMPLGDLVNALSTLSRRGVTIILCRPRERPIRIRPGAAGAALLSLLAEAHSGARSVQARARAESDQLLSDAEITDIRRLFKAGLTPRRIGLIYRRSPRCIADLLAGRLAETQAENGLLPSRIRAASRSAG